MVSDLWVKASRNWLGCWIREIWIDLTFPQKSGFWWNFAMTSPETLYMKTPLMNTAFCWLLIWPILTHGLGATDFWCRVPMLNCFGQLGPWKEIPALGPEMNESWRGWIMNSVAHLLSFSTPTQSHDFANHSNGYGRSKIALVQS
jgi:hypothetical protein